jgi:hypothetical protein
VITLTSQDEKLMELLRRLKALTEKQAEIEKKIAEFEVNVKTEEPEE